MFYIQTNYIQFLDASDGIEICRETKFPSKVMRK